MNLPSVVFRSDTYHADLKVMAWNAAGWASQSWSEAEFGAWGPASIRDTIDLDVVEIAGGLDARLP